jgi:uncharacterized protein (TIGR02145 family)
MNKLKIISLTASMVLAMVFIFSCSSDDEGGGVTSSSVEDGESSSSEGGEGISQTYSYCLLSEEKMCLDGPFTSKDCNTAGGYPSNSCPYGGSQIESSSSSVDGEQGGESSSSSEPPPSSSSNEPPPPSFSSSSIPSSSSIVPSSSSTVVSSSSSIPSSSSIVPSSSSAVVSSSSEPPPSSSSYESSNESSVFYNGQTYRTVKIGEQVWFAENLNSNPGTGKSACYSNQTKNCATYGRLYDWATAMALSSSCNSNSCSSQIQQPHRGICPSGWHIPGDADWDKLFRYVDGTSGTSVGYISATASRYLKATEGWLNCGPSSSYSYFCEDTYGFSALPGGLGGSDGSFANVGDFGYWWSANESSSDYAYGRLMGYDDDGAYWSSYDKSLLQSVRCVQD